MHELMKISSLFIYSRLWHRRNRINGSWYSYVRYMPKTFALAEIVKFIQHKVLQCNKENYGQCFSQGKLKQMILSLIEAYNGGTLSGTSGDRDSDDGRSLSFANSRRPSISAPISRKSSISRVHSPPLASPTSHLLEDGSTSTPKRLSEGMLFIWNINMGNVD